MANDDLIRMANQIAHFFEPYPPDEAVAGVAEHLKKFWDPSMRAQLIKASAAAPSTVHPLVGQVVAQLSEAVRP